MLALAACAGGGDGVGPAGGRFTLTRSTKQGTRTLVAAPATASWCADDTSLAVVVVTARGDGGAAARLRWPLRSLTTFQVGRHLAAVGTATLAWRPVADTARAALVADSGQLRLQGAGAALVSGSFTAWARADLARAADTSVARLDGRLERVPVVSRCSGSR